MDDDVMLSLAISPMREERLIDMLIELEEDDGLDAAEQVAAIQRELAGFGVRLG